jgi:dephospho-CoA kinase
MALPQPKLPKTENTMDRIAFAGPMCVGKTYLAKGLELQGYYKLSFANLLKSLAYNLYGIQNKDNISRKLLQEFADDLKKWDKNLFITYLLSQSKKEIENGYTKLVVDDLRFITEEDALRRNGFTIINVTCDEDIRLTRINRLYPDMEASRMNHASENNFKLMKFDYTVLSNEPIANYDLLAVIENGNTNSFYR